MSDKSESKRTLINENQRQIRTMASLMSHRDFTRNARRSYGSGLSHHVFKSAGGERHIPGQNQFNARNNALVDSSPSIPENSDNTNDGVSDLPDEGLSQSPSDTLNNINSTSKPDEKSDAKQGDKVAEKAKTKAYQKGIEAAASLHPVAKAVVSNPIGKKVTAAVSEQLAKKKRGFGAFGLGRISPFGNENNADTSTSGSFSVDLKHGVKIISTALPCVIVLVFMACIIPYIIAIVNNRLASIFLASQLEDPEKVKELLNNELEELIGDEKFDDSFEDLSKNLSTSSSSSSSTSSSSSSSTSSSSSSSSSLSSSDSQNDNSTSYVKVTGGFKDKIYYYCQTDYTDPYGYGGYGSIAENGCGPTSLAIAISSITKEEHDPIEVTNYLCENDGCTPTNGSKFLEMQETAKHYGELYGFDVTITTDEELVKSKLSEGNSLVVTVTNGWFYTNEGSRLSRGGHFFVLTGVADDRNVYIVDPYTPAHTGQTVDIYDLSINNHNVDSPGLESYYILTRRN